MLWRSWFLTNKSAYQYRGRASQCMSTICVIKDWVSWLCVITGAGVLSSCSSKNCWVAVTLSHCKCQDFPSNNYRQLQLRKFSATKRNTFFNPISFGLSHNCFIHIRITASRQSEKELHAQTKNFSRFVANLFDQSLQLPTRWRCSLQTKISKGSNRFLVFRSKFSVLTCRDKALNNLRFFWRQAFQTGIQTSADGLAIQERGSFIIMSSTSRSDSNSKHSINSLTSNSGEKLTSSCSVSD